MKPQAVIVARVSSSKQANENDSPNQQMRDGIDFVGKQGWVVDRTMSFVESGRKSEREFFNEVIDYCVDRKNNISYLVARDISRFTRGGGVEYRQLKDRLKKAGVQLQDTQGTIQSDKNSMEKYGLEYSWSRYSPSEAEEIKQADQAKDQVRQSLTLMLGAEIEYVREGYWNRRPPYGFANKKIQTEEHGIRTILVEKPSEGIFIKKLFSMRSKGIHSDEEIVREVNALGYKSRKYFRRDKRTKKPIGAGGEKPLTIKQLQKYVKNPIYAGVICEKWTHYKLVKGRFNGLVDVDTFNQANVGKVMINEDETGVFFLKHGKQNEDGRIIKRRTNNNPFYPYKNVVLCPICKNPLKASASTGKLGKKYPAYHCNRNHEYWRKSREDLHEVVYSFIKKIRFSDEYITLFEASFLEVWKNKRDETLMESEQAERNVVDLLVEQKSIRDAIKITTNKAMIRAYEDDYENIELKIQSAREFRAGKEKRELDAKLAVKSAVYLMEHLEELLIDQENIRKIPYNNNSCSD